ncbi:MAG: class I SAM-dependent methyltransferase [Acidobacteriia bacterium]|nr:class I SAM-dependent methyltransferase [Terriglobia bacterium]
MPNEHDAPLEMNCPSCGSELGHFPTSQQNPIRCPQCGYCIAWDGDCWDACVDKTYPGDSARQWVLWEAGKLGDPNLVYGHDPKYYFREMLKHTALTEEGLIALRILEVGYGHGRLLHELQRWSPMAYGIDLAKPLRSAQLRPGSAILGNLLNIPFMPHQFDLVICRGVIHCTPDPQKSFGCVAEQVANKGVLYLAGLYEPGKGNLLLRKILPWSWHYPEFLRLGMASVFSVVRATMEAVQTRMINFRAFQRFYRHYKLDIFDVMSPRWTRVYTKDEVVPWFTSQGFLVQKVGYGAYVGVKTDLPRETSPARS